MLFNPSTSFFVLAVDSHNVPDATERAVSLIKKVFQKYYEEYKLPYKLVLFDHLDFCENLEQSTKYSITFPKSSAEFLSCLRGRRLPKY